MGFFFSFWFIIIIISFFVTFLYFFYFSFCRCFPPFCQCVSISYSSSCFLPVSKSSLGYSSPPPYVVTIIVVSSPFAATSFPLYNLVCHSSSARWPRLSGHYFINLPLVFLFVFMILWLFRFTFLVSITFSKKGSICTHTIMQHCLFLK